MRKTFSPSLLEYLAQFALQNSMSVCCVYSLSTECAIKHDISQYKMKAVTKLFPKYGNSRHSNNNK